MPTREITTKKFSSETTNATPANDDRILFSDTSDGGAPKDATIAQILADFVDKLTDQDIDGLKTFLKAGKFGYDNNTSGGNLTVNGFDHVYYEFAVNLARKAYMGFASSGLTSLDIVNEFTNGNIKLQPGSGGNVLVGSQNWTSAWTDYTPVRTGGITVSSLTVNSASYKQIGKTVYVQSYITLTPSSSGPTIDISLPVSPITGKHFTLAIWVSGTTANAACYVDNPGTGKVTFEYPFVSGTPISIMFNGVYESV